TIEIRANDVTENVSEVSAISEVRKEMVKLQRKIASEKDSVIDGRDIGTVVFPNAEHKFFIDADLKVRAERRIKDLSDGEKYTIEELMEKIKTRDEFDSTRKDSPLKKAEDSILIDTTNMTIEEQTKKIIDIVKENDQKLKGENLMIEELNENVEQNPQEELVSEAEKINTGDVYASLKKVKREDLVEKPIEEDDEVINIYSRTLNKFDNNDIVNGHVIRISDKFIYVDIGFKSEGIIAINEFGENIPESGDEILVYVEKLEDDEGQLILSKQKADFLKSWDNLKEKYENEEIIQGEIKKRIKGGMVVDVLGIDAFLPGSQIDVNPVVDFDSYVGKTMDFKIVNINESRKNIVISHKEILVDSLKDVREELLSQIQVDQIIKGKVKNITDFGAFIDLGGVDGLLHITDMSWGRVNHPSEICKIDEVIEVKVIDYDTEKQRVSLGLKQMTSHPWENIEEKYPIDSEVEGKVVSITNYGVFIELEEGIEGLIHISEMSWTQQIKHPSELFSMGDIVKAQVLSMNQEDRKISFGVKQLTANPWEKIGELFTEGMVVDGIVRNLTHYGAFIELDNGIDGLLHISDMAWMKHVKHPKELFRRDDKIEVKILNVDIENKKISLGYKQLQENPWDAIIERYKIGTMIKAPVLKILEKGIILELPEDMIEAIVPLYTLPRAQKRELTKDIKIGDELELRVSEINQDDNKVVLSIDDLSLNEEEKEVASEVGKQDETTQKIEISDDIKMKITAKEKKEEEKAKEEKPKTKKKSTSTTKKKTTSTTKKKSTSTTKKETTKKKDSKTKVKEEDKEEAKKETKEKAKKETKKEVKEDK
ncbi:MAG: 30S ribosomal protein S1, partial [Candidatus Marinimicrobia bacterium]|nr:30S ribosomal protein S1 [Candidatus Neomarinimicrobiota bacterium]